MPVHLVGELSRGGVCGEGIEKNATVTEETEVKQFHSIILVGVWIEGRLKLDFKYVDFKLTENS